MAPSFQPVANVLTVVLSVSDKNPVRILYEEREMALDLKFGTLVLSKEANLRKIKGLEDIGGRWTFSAQRTGSG